MYSLNKTMHFTEIQKNISLDYSWIVLSDKHMNCTAPACFKRFHKANNL